MTAQHDILLSHKEFDILWGDLGLGPMPYPIDMPSVGSTMEERGRIRAEVYRDLAARDLAHGERMDALLAELLGVLGKHEIAVDTVGYLHGPIRAVVVTDRRIGALAALTEDGIWLAEIRPTALAGSIAELIPDNAAGPGKALSFPHQALLDAVAQSGAADEVDEDDPYGGSEVDDERIALTRAGMSSGDASVLCELANDRNAGGQFGLSVRGHRVPTLITWFDTSQGRYLMVREDSWLSLSPADNERIERRLATVLSNSVQDDPALS
jgi:hypothetical protein